MIIDTWKKDGERVLVTSVGKPKEKRYCARIKSTKEYFDGSLDEVTVELASRGFERMVNR